jgi:hypothetical protein
MEDRIVKYRVMHEDTPVVEIDFYTDEIVLFNKDFLPFPLRNKDRLGAVAVFEWIMKRINNLNRPNMDKAVKSASIQPLDLWTPDHGTSHSNEVILPFTGTASDVKNAVLTARELGLKVLTAMGSYPESPSEPYIL